MAYADEEELAAEVRRLVGDDLVHALQHVQLLADVLLPLRQVEPRRQLPIHARGGTFLLSFNRGTSATSFVIAARWANISRARAGARRAPPTVPVPAYFLA